MSDTSFKYKDSTESFQRTTSEHQLTILHDEGVFRHLSIGKPGDSNQRYEITTWPQHLCISGDMGTYVFSRLHDMFDYFVSEIGTIKPDSWSEKLQAGAGCGHRSARKFDAKVVDKRLDEALASHLDALTRDGSADNEELKADAIEAVDDFKRYREDAEWDCVSRINNWDPEDAGGLSLDDFWEGHRDPFTYHYLWCCHAIVHAITLYNKAKAI